METTAMQDVNAKLNQIFHQYMLMLRDPLIYLAINEETGGFSKTEMLGIKLAKQRGMVNAVKPDNAMKITKELESMINPAEDPEIAILLKLNTAGVYMLLGDMQAVRSTIQEATFFVQRNRVPYLELGIEAIKLLLSHRESKNIDIQLEALSNRIDEAEHPYFRCSLITWVGLIYMRNHYFEIALAYYTMAYEIAENNQMTTLSLELALWILQCAAELGKIELGEQFNIIGEELISRLRLPQYNFKQEYHYGKLKMAQEDYPAAVLFLQKSIASFKKGDIPVLSLYISSLRTIAEALNHLKEPSRALSYLIQAEEAVKQQNVLGKEMDLNLDIATTMVELDRWDEAIPRLITVADFYRKHQKNNKLLVTARLIAQYHAMNNNFEDAYKLLLEIDKINTHTILEVKLAHSQHSADKLRLITHESHEVQAKYNNLLREMSRRTYERFSGISEAARRVVDAATLAAMQKDSNVFLSGENGAGKKIVAQMIHYGSEESKGEFYNMNCSALPEKELESKFFGEPSSQVGDNLDKCGYFALAAGGTLYIDEVTALPMDFQMRLADVIESGHYLNRNSGKAEKITCRIISSSSKNMLRLVREGSFNLNLLNKLSTLEISVPPLRERKEDLPQLVENFVRNISWESSKSMPKIERSFYTRLSSYEFPGNISELKNIIEQLFILYYKPVWDAEILENITAFRETNVKLNSLLESDIQEIDRERIKQALRKTGGKQKYAAKLLNMSESTLCRRIQKYGIKR